MFGHRVQTPQIFEKTLQLPPRLPGQAAHATNTIGLTGVNTKLNDGMISGSV